MNGKTLLIALLFVAAAGGGYYVLTEKPAGDGGGTAVPKIDEQQPENTTDDQPEVEARQASGQITIDPDRVPREKRLRTPDGQWVAALNDAVNVPDFGGSWPPDREWSPIVRVQTDSQGTQWWVHADGSQSTSLMQFRRDLGRMDAILNIANPAEAAPTFEEPTGPVRPGAGR